MMIRQIREFLLSVDNDQINLWNIVNAIDGPEAKELFEKLITKRSNKK